MVQVVKKLPPADLKEVRIGFLGPLEGSVIQFPGKADAPGINAGH